MMWLLASVLALLWAHQAVETWRDAKAAKLWNKSPWLPHREMHFSGKEPEHELIHIGGANGRDNKEQDS